MTFAACKESDEAERIPLTIESLKPEIGGPGTELIINGTGYPLDKSLIDVSINGITLPVENCNREQILVVIPENRAIGVAPVKVTVGGETVTSPMNFTYFDETMYIESVEPTTGGPGTEITITGGNFPAEGTGVEVSVNGVAFPVKSGSETQIVATVPNNPNIGTGPVKVAVGNNELTSEAEFVYIEPVIAISSISPEKGGALTEVTITGENFPPVSDLLSVTINDIALNVISSSATEMVVSIPQNDAMGKGPIVIKYGSQTVTSTQEFEYVISQLSIQSIAPLSGKANTEITITGTGFVEGLEASINGVALTITSQTATEIKATVPRNRKVGTGPVLLVKENDRAASTESFTYLMTRTVSLLAGSGNSGYIDGQGAEASFSFSNGWEERRGGIAVDNSQNVFVADPGSMTIRKITPDGVVSTHAGGGPTDNPDWGINWRQEGGSYNPEFRPTGMALNPNNGFIYVVDDWIGGMFAVEPDGKTHYLGLGDYASTCAVDVTSNRFYFFSISKLNVRYSDMDDYGYNGASAINNAFNGKKIGGMVADAEGNLYVAAYEENKIYKYEKDNWTKPILIAGSGQAGCKDGPALEAEFSTPWGLALDNDGNLLVAGNGNGTGSAANADNSIRLIDLKNNTVTTFAGSGSGEGLQLGSFDVPAAGGIDNRTADNGLFPAFCAPSAVAVDKQGTVYVLSRGDNKVYKIVTEE